MNRMTVFGTVSLLVHRFRLKYLDQFQRIAVTLAADIHWPQRLSRITLVILLFSSFNIQDVLNLPKNCLLAFEIVLLVEFNSKDHSVPVQCCKVYIQSCQLDCNSVPLLHINITQYIMYTLGFWSPITINHLYGQATQAPFTQCQRLVSDPF